MGFLAAAIPSIIGVGASLLGGKKVTGDSEATSQQSSYNQAYPMMASEYGGIQPAAREATASLNDLLSGNTDGLAKFRDSTGFNSVLSQGMSGITGAAAGKGLLRSGGTGKALQAYGQNISSQYTQNYIDTLLKKAGLGMDAGKLIAATGQTSSGTSREDNYGKSGMSGLLGSLFSSIGAG